MSETVSAELLAQAIEELKTLAADVDRRVKKAYQQGRANGQAQYRAEIRDMRKELQRRLVCVDCLRPYGDVYGFPDFVVPNEVWKTISPTGDEGGLLCPCCMMSRMCRQQLTGVPGKFTSGPCRIP